VVTQSQPASSSKPTADFEVMAWNAVSLLWLNQAPPGLGGADERHGRFPRLYREIERLFKSRTRQHR
jgi:hypothetical protein